MGFLIGVFFPDIEDDQVVLMGIDMLFDLFQGHETYPHGSLRDHQFDSLVAAADLFENDVGHRWLTPG